MEFQLSCFKSWKMMLWKCCTQYASKFGKLSRGHRTGKRQFSFQFQRKAMLKNAQTTAQLHSSQFSSVQSLSCVRLFATPWIAARQALCPSPTPRVHWDSNPLSQWCHPAISSSVVPLSSCPQSVTHTLLGYKRMNFCHLQQHYRLRGHYAKWSKSEKDKYEITYMWNLKITAS